MSLKKSLLTTTSITSRPINYLVFSDVHLGHERTKTSEIIQALNKFFDSYLPSSPFAKLDAIFIAGDLFDTLLDLSGKEIHEIQIWAHRLMEFCSKHDIILRVMEGTPSHDWKQSHILETVAHIADYSVDFKYVPNLSIERLDKLGLTVLYVPDLPNTDKIKQQVQACLDENGLVEVDIAIMHGMFTYQMAGIPGKHDLHDEAYYLSIVKHYINIGHNHSFSVFDRIISQGSTDRLAHGEEEPKGAVLVTIDPNKGNSFVFIENKEAKNYKTITLRSKDIDACYKQIDKAVSHLKVDDYVRIKASKDHPLYRAFDELKTQYPMLNFSKTVLTADDEAKPLAYVDTEQTYTALAITKDNIIPLLLAEIATKHTLTDTQNSVLIDLLQGAH